MNADPADATVRQVRPIEPGRTPWRWWVAIVTLLAAAAFLEAVFAGAMLSGAGWARAAHRATALLLIASTAASGLVSFITLRRTPGGLKLAISLTALAALLVLQAAVGVLSAKGANLLWAHVPLGVVLVGLAGQTAIAARGLGGK